MEVKDAEIDRQQGELQTLTVSSCIDLIKDFDIIIVSSLCSM